MPLSPVPCLLRCATSIFRCADTWVCRARAARTRRCPASRRACPARAATARTAPSREHARAVSLWTSRRTGGLGRDTASTPVHHHHVFTKLPPQHSHNHRTSTNTSTNTSTASTAVCNSKKNRPPSISPPYARTWQHPTSNPTFPPFFPNAPIGPPVDAVCRSGGPHWVFFFRTQKRRKIQADASPVSINSPK